MNQQDQVVQAVMQHGYMLLQNGMPADEIIRRFAYGLGRFAMNASMEVDMGIKKPNLGILEDIAGHVAQGYKDEAEQYHAITVS